MQKIVTVKDLQAYSAGAMRPLGLVPTMGALHPGHLALVQRARATCQTVVVSIFVNPTQFGPNEDLSRYPRQLDRDLELLINAHADAVFIPSVEEMYPSGLATKVHIDGPALPLEGQLRPGHFDGVATVVAKLFMASLPNVAFFGQKDAQQVAVVRRMTADLNLPVAIETVPTVREPDGLAMSSRNAYLSPQQRRAAAVLYRALCAARDLFKSGERAPAVLEGRAQSILAEEPDVREVEYAALVDWETMGSWRWGSRPLMVVAARVGNIRLIDNLFLDDEG